MSDSEFYVYFTDPNGDSVRFYNHKGTPLITVPGMRERLEHIADTKARDDDVLICGYSKSGTHWVWDVVKMVIDGSTEPINRLKAEFMLEFHSVDQLEAMPSPRVLNNHFPLDEIPPDFLSRKCKMVYLLRNPKDITVSHFHHIRNLKHVYEYSGEWNGFLELWLRGEVDNGSWFTYVKNWEKSIKARSDLNIHVLHFEDLKRDFMDEVKKLTSFLGVSRNEDFIKTLAEMTSFHRMKSHKSTLYTDADKSVWRNRQPLMYRKGTVGDWKNYFTVAQNELFDSCVERELKDSDLTFCYDIRQ